MSDGTTIEWTQATWNPVRGCTRVSRGCGGPGDAGGCYAEAMAARFAKPGQWGHGFAEMRNGKPRWTGKVALVESALGLPTRWREPRRIFVNSTSDLFHEDLPNEAIGRVFDAMARAPQHTYQILTKRPERMRAFMRSLAVPHHLCHGTGCNYCGDYSGLVPWDGYSWPNVWLGTSVEDQPTADERIPHLLATPAAVRFVSYEPALGPVNLRNLYHGETITDALDGISEIGVVEGHDRYVAINPQYREHAKLDWIICGGESGPNARPMHPTWARSVRDQCAAAGVAFFFKQWGEHDELTLRVGKCRAGGLLDGRTHDEFPEPRP